MRRAARRRKQLEKKREAGRRWYAANRERERARARTFRERHPEKLREYRRRFRERHPERAAEQARRASREWRDRNADDVRERQRSTAAARREQDPDAFRRWYEANLERERARSREASRLRSRLKKLGLPPRKVHRVYAEQKRQHAADAKSFFDTKRTPSQLNQLALEAPHRAGDLATSRAAREVKAARARAQSPSARAEAAQRAAHARERVRWARMLPVLIGRFEASNGPRVREEVRMDSIARQRAGKPAYDVDVETAKRLRREALNAALARLVPDRDPAAIERARKVIVSESLNRLPAPTQTVPSPPLMRAESPRASRTLGR